MEDLDEYFSDPFSFLSHDLEDEEDDEFYDFDDTPRASEQPDPEESLPFNEWCQKVSTYISLLTDHAESIETVGWDHWWYDWWKDGLSAESAATLGLREHILLEDE
jgi:hypothetical protein